MRKSFTRVFGIFILSMMMTLYGLAQPSLTTGTLTNIKKTDKLMLLSDKAVTPGTGVVRLLDALGNPIKTYQASNSSFVTISDKKNAANKYEITVDFTSYLAEETAYQLEVDANFVKDATAGNAAVAAAAVQVGDWTAPILKASTPFKPKSTETVNVQLGEVLEVTFNEDVKLAAGAQVHIYTDNGTSYGNLFETVSGGSLAIKAGDAKTIQITASKPFVQLTKYYVTIPKGSIVDQPDIFGNDNQNKYEGWLNDATKWYFTVRDNTIASFTKKVADNIAKDKFDVFMQLDKAGTAYVMAVPKGAAVPANADFTAGNGMKTKAVDAASKDFYVTLTQYYTGAGAANLQEGVEYDVYAYTENTQVAANVMNPAQKIISAVKTLDVTSPVATLFPLDGAVNVTTASMKIHGAYYIALSFSAGAGDVVKKGNGSVSIYKWDNNSPNHTEVLSVPIADCKLTVDPTATTTTQGDSLYIPVPQATWESAQTYFVKFPQGLVTDLSTNPIAGITNTEDWKFTIIDYLAPTVTITENQTATTAANKVAKVIATYNEQICSDNVGTLMNDAAFKNALLIEKLSGTSKVAVNAADYVVSNVGNKTFTIDLTVVSEGTYYVTIQKDKVFDLIGNKRGVADPYTLNVKDFEAPVVTFKPDLNTVAANYQIGKTDDFVIEFNEPVYRGDNGAAIDDAYVAAHVILRKGTDNSGAFVTATYTVAPNAKSFIINPANDFTAVGDLYWLELGAGTVKDAAGNAIAYQSAQYVVDDFQKPTATFKYAAGTAFTTALVNPTGLVPYVEFTEGVKKLDGTAIANGADATTYINFKENGENVLYTATWDLLTDPAKPHIVITYGFGNSKQYDISIGKSLIDNNNNSFDGASVTFNTYSTAAPSVSLKSPDSNEHKVVAGKVVEVTFNEKISAGANIALITVTSNVSGALAYTTEISDKVLKIKPTVALLPNETITVSVPAGAVINTATVNNALFNWSFYTYDTVAPTFDDAHASTDPKVNVGGQVIAVSDKLVLAFTEKVVLKTGTIYIRRNADGVAVQTLSQANCQLDNATGKVLTITPVAALEYGTTYYVEITPGLVEDVEANPFAGFAGNAGATVWDFTTTATPGAFTVDLVKSSPADFQDKIAAGLAAISVKFNRTIKTNSLSSANRISLTEDGVTVINDLANSARFSIAGDILTVNLQVGTNVDIKANKTYVLTLDNGVVKDNYSTDNTGNSITFYTFDNNGPKVIDFTPSASTTPTAPVGSNIIIKWDEVPVLKTTGATIEAATIKSTPLVTVAGGTAYTAYISDGGLTWTLVMDAPFAEKTTYTVDVKQNDVKDALNNSQGGSKIWSFMTEDKTIAAPKNFAVVAGGNTTGTQVDFTVEFNEEGNVYYLVAPKADGTKTVADIIAADKKIAYAAGVNVWTASATQNAKSLTSSVEYTFWFVAKDKIGNTSTVYSADVTTFDNIKPIATINAPLNTASNQEANVDLVLTFNEKVNIGTGHVIIRELATDIIVRDINIAAPNAGNGEAVSLDATQLKATIDFGGVLASQTTYYVEVVGGSFKDLSNNPMEKIVGSDKWSFTVKDTDAPLLVSTTPDYTKVAPNLPEVKKDVTFTMEFNESVKPGTGALVVYYKSNIGGIIVAGDEFEVVNVNQMDFSVDKKVSFTLVNTPVEQTDFYVTIPNTLIKDNANNNFANGLKAGGVLGNSWDFIILDQTPPALTSAQVQKVAGGAWVNAVNATGVDINSNIQVNYTENIFKSPNATVFTAAELKALVSVTSAAGTVVELNSVTLVGGTQLDIDPKNALVSETEYHVTVGAVVDNKLNANTGVSFKFTTKDMTPPVATITPTHNTTINPKTGVVTVKMNEPVFDEVLINTAEGNNIVFEIKNENIPSFFTYKRVTSKTDMTQIGVNIQFTGVYDATANVITLTPKATELPFASEGWYRVELLAGVIRDAANNGIASTVSVFQIEDHVKPVVAAGGYSPMTPVAATPTSALKITFDTPVQLGSGNVYVRNYVNGDVMEQITLDASKVSYSNGDKTVTITHAAFAANMKFFVTADAGTFTDKSSNKNPWVGIETSAINTWVFSTADGVKPTLAVDGLYPKNEAKNVAVGTNLEVTLSKQVFAGTTRIVIYNEDWTPAKVINANDASQVTFKAVTDPVYELNRIMVINPTTDLASKSKYYVRIEEGALVDAANNAYAGLLDLSWSFTTEDNTAPAKLSVEPTVAGGPASVTPTLKITFDRDVEANAAGKVHIYKEIDNTSQLGILIESIASTDAVKVKIANDVVTITPSTKLEYNTNYYVIVELGAFTNTSTSKLPFAGITTTQGWKFTTKTDDDKPTLVGVKSSVAGTSVNLKPADVKLEMTLSENVKLSTTGGNVVVYNAADDQMVETIAIKASDINGAKVTVTPTAMKEQMSYYVKVDATALVDNAPAANAFAGITDKTTWTFTTGDFTAPKKLDVSPKGGATITDNHPAELVLTLDENVTLTATGGNVKICKVGTTTATVTIPLTAAMINGKVITITYDAKVVGGLDKNTDYYVLVDANALKDNANNPFPGIVDQAAWTFKTGANFKTGIEDDVNVSFKVYPNPFVNELKVDNASELSRIVITSMTGQKVKEIVNPTSTIQTSELRSGVYFISLYVDDVVAKTERIVKR